MQKALGQYVLSRSLEGAVEHQRTSDGVGPRGLDALTSSPLKSSSVSKRVICRLFLVESDAGLENSV